MKTKVLSPEEYEALPRKQKREMERSLKKQGLEHPDIRPRIQWYVDIEKELLIEGLPILERNHLSPGEFIDICFQNLIKAKHEDKCDDSI